MRYFPTYSIDKRTCSNLQEKKSKKFQIKCTSIEMYFRCYGIFSKMKVILLPLPNKWIHRSDLTIKFYGNPTNGSVCLIIFAAMNSQLQHCIRFLPVLTLGYHRIPTLKIRISFHGYNASSTLSI